MKMAVLTPMPRVSAAKRGESKTGIVGEHAQRVLNVIPQIAHRAVLSVAETELNLIER